jgi:hypothetical protein
MPLETKHSVEKNKKDEEKSFVEHLVELRNIVGRVMSGDIESGSGVSNTVGHQRFDPQNLTTRSTVVSDDSSTSDDSNSADDSDSSSNSK